jgi:intracellular septation protein
MRLLLDFFPIVLFFAAYKLEGVYVATGVLMAATALQMAIIYAMDRRLQTMHKATLALVLIFGALTIGLHDERFIKWKPTVLYGAMAVALAAALWVWKKNVLHMLLGMTIFLLFPFSRLVHIWSGFAAVGYALRPYQVVRTRRS